jgi:hypothetical protein
MASKEAKFFEANMKRKPPQPTSGRLHMEIAPPRSSRVYELSNDFSDSG